jgi:hypothetical protein
LLQRKVKLTSLLKKRTSLPKTKVAERSKEARTKMAITTITTRASRRKLTNQR